MGLIETIFSTFLVLKSNKLRTTLTVLGVIIGVAAVITVVSIGEGARAVITSSIEKLGTNLVFIFPTELTESELSKYPGRSEGLTLDDLMAVRKSAPFIQNISPGIIISGMIKYENKGFPSSAEGVFPQYSEMRNLGIEKGRFLIDSDMQNYNRVAVLGKDAASRLFETASPTGKYIKINDERFTVVGVMEPKGQVHGTNYDEKIFIPASTALKFFRGNEKLDFIIVQVDKREHAGDTMEKAERIILNRHFQVPDFKVRTQEEFRKAVDDTVTTFRFMLGSIALVSLLVGGIGIMNIMLVTVTERTKEIGLRKALGATRGDILRQFLVEAVIISLFGGIIGIVIGTGVGIITGRIVAKALPGNGEWGAIISIESIIVAFIFSLSVGIFFGLYPAIKASKLDPAIALRYE